VPAGRLWCVAKQDDANSELRHFSKGANTLPAELLKISAEAPDPSILRYACDFILRGDVVGVPTDTFYGLAADPFNLSAVEQIYRVKGRPEARALPILVNSVEQAEQLQREASDAFLCLAEKFWPGALTILVDASDKLPLKVTANTGKVALRWPNSKVACALIEALEGPLTGTSANISGFPACSNAHQLMKQLGERLPLVLDSGETGASLASTIVDIHDDHWRILREGAITEGEIRAVLDAGGAYAG
jgi:tRNA threonylcarbamoyl adenosine modification protein (Sua5/YciO/YrdC/YwlC family)